MGMFALASLSSCNKDPNDPNNPENHSISKRIQSISYSEESNSYNSGQVLLEKWNWNADGFLETIDNYDGDDISFIIYFNYDTKQRVTSVDCYKYGVSVTYNYNNETNLMDTLKLFVEGELIANVAALYHADGNLKRLMLNVFNVNIFRTATKYVNPFDVLFPKMIGESILNLEDQFAQQRNGNEVISVVLQFTWENGNISKIIGEGVGYMATVTLQYESSNAFLYGFLLGQYNGKTLCKNNPTLATATVNQKTTVYLANYAYDAGNYPIKVTAYPANETNNKLSGYITYE